MLRTVDLFSGVGGLGLGFNKAGFDVVAAYDNWKWAATVHVENLNHPLFLIDLSYEKEAVQHIAHFSPQVIIGGPPCQDFSSAGKRVESKNANLTCSFARIVAKLQPEIFVMENVVRARQSASYAFASKLFCKQNYGLTEMVLDASYCGVPQTRKRFFCIGVKDAENGMFSCSLTASQTPEPLTVGEYMGDDIGTNFYYRHPRNYSRRAIYSIDEPSATIRGVNRPIPPNYPGHPRDAAPIEKARPLTPHERSRIQTFPKSWEWSGCKTTVEQMIGNAVPVELGRFVGHAILRELQ